MSVAIELVSAATDEVVKAFGRLLPRANRLYERLGFQLRDANVYRFAWEH